jgi:hypothetical protein
MVKKQMTILSRIGSMNNFFSEATEDKYQFSEDCAGKLESEKR